MDSLLSSLIAVAIGLLAVVTVAAGWPWLKNSKQGYPFEAQIEAALADYAELAIAAGYRASEIALDEIGQRLDGVDKKAFANAVYDMLPAEVGGVPIAVVKAIVTRERFGQLVQDAFSQFDIFWDARQARFEKLYKEWRDNQPPF